MAFIANVAYIDVKNGNHPFTGNDVLIQIVDPAMEFPEPKYDFTEVHRYEFLDVSEHDTMFKDAMITLEQAKNIVEVLTRAIEADKNVIVHCVAGLCRSGAVVEAGIAMGFQDTFRVRHPNIFVKKMLFRALGNYCYDELQKGN